MVALKALRGGLLAALLTLLTLPLAAEPLPEAVEARRLVGREQRLSLDVHRQPASRWIRFEAEYETAYPVGIDEILAILHDHGNGHKVWRRVISVKVLPSDDSSVVTEQVWGVKAFGIEFYSSMRYRNSTTVDPDGSTRLGFVQLEEGGKVHGSRGGWHLADLSTPGSPLTYVRYRLEFETLAQFPGQEAIIRTFGPGDMQRTMAELGEAALRKRTTGASGDQPSGSS